MTHHLFSKKLRFLALSTLLSFCIFGAATGQELESTRLKETISKGTGDINLLLAQGNKAISPATLEHLRSENNGDLVLGVDVNEAASGTEKAATQGVAIEALLLTVSTDEGVYEYTNFSTQTKSSLAKTSTESRQFYHTLIGRTGSNNITGSGLNGTSFDATLRIPVDIDLSSANSVHLAITLLETNEDLGDPEAFYDYSAGFEDLALLIASDAEYLDTQAAGQADAPLVVLTNAPASFVSKVYYPAADSFYMVGYEDQFPKLGDYDFNDLVVAYRVIFSLNSDMQVTAISSEGYLVARGGSFDHNWHLRIALPEGSQAGGTYQLYAPLGSSQGSEQVNAIDTTSGLDISIFQNTTSLFSSPSSTYANTIWDEEVIQGHKFSFEIALSNPVSLDAMDTAPFDPYLYVFDTNYEIHLEGQSPVMPNSNNIADGLDTFTDDRGYPFALVFPEDWHYPNEYVDMGDAYPELIEFIQSNRNNKTDWYKNGVPSGISKRSKADWAW